MRITAGLLAVGAIALLAAGCAGSPDIEPAPVAPARFTIIEHKNSALGGDVPDWATMDVGELEQDERFEGRRVYRFEETGRDLAGVKTVAESMRAPSAISREVSTRVEQIFAGAEVGDQDFVETYFENVVKTVSQTEVNGFRKYGDFWVLKQYVDADGAPGEQEYAYYTLYTVDESIIAELVERAIDGIDVDTEEERSARDRVRQILRDEF